MPVAAIRFGSVSPEWFDSTDAEFLAALKWRDHETQLRPVDSDAATLKTVGLAWKQQCLEHRSHKVRNSFATLDRALRNNAACLPSVLSALRDLDHRSATKKAASQRRAVDAVNDADQGGAPKDIEAELRAWLRTQQQRDEPLVVLACLEQLLFRADRLAASTIGELWRWTLSAALRLSEELIEIEETEETEQLLGSDEAMSAALSSGLLPWLCGLFFDDVKGAPKLAKSGRKSLSALLVSGTEDSGAPVATIVRRLPEWLDLWTDALVAGKRFEQTLFKESHERRFANLLKATTAITVRKDVSESCRMLAALPGLLSQRYEEPWAASLEAVLKGTKIKADENAKKKEAPSWQSDTCSIACMRTSWRSDASHITVLHDRKQLSIEMTVKGQSLLSGDWGLSVINQQQALVLTKDWECCCWYTDAEVDYAEWIAESADGVKVCRWAMLHRSDEYAILSDVVKQASPQRVDVQSTLPLSDGWTSTSLPGTREQRFELASSSSSAALALRVFPLMLPQDVGFGTSGQVVHQPGSFSLSTAATGGGLFSPIVLDWSSKRAGIEAEWRELTVSEAGTVDSTSGRGFRIALGKHNLLLMRGLRTITRYRTVLGYQTWNETVIASLNKDGIFDEIVLVEQ